jgi:hypothetical protein
MQSTDSSAGLNREQRQSLLEVARQSIEHGLSHRKSLRVPLKSYPSILQRPGAAFVTLRKAGQLRGCIGSLNACQPLVQDVATHAFDAAFKDPRFPTLDAAELSGLDIHISVLSEPMALEVVSEDELLTLLRPGKDGLVLEDGQNRATFLPAVWEQLPEPLPFLRQLKFKAGLPLDHWSTSIRFYRYSTESFPE